MAKKYHSTNQFCKRALALSLALATAIGSWSVDWNTIRVNASAEEFVTSDGEVYSEGDVIKRTFTNTNDSSSENAYVKITGATFYIEALTDAATCTARVMQDGVVLGPEVNNVDLSTGENTISGLNAVVAPGESAEVQIIFTQSSGATIRLYQNASGDKMELTTANESAPNTKVTITATPSSKMMVGSTDQISAESEAYNRAIRYTSSDTEVLEVGETSGVITAKKAGTAKITASTTTEGDTTAETENIEVVGVTYGSTSLTYNGNEQAPSVTVTGASTLVEGRDYDVSGAATAVGDYTVTVSGNDSYSFISSSTSFSILPANISGDGVLNLDNAAYTIDTTTSEVTAVTGVKFGSRTLTFDQDFTATCTRTSSSQTNGNYTHTYTVTLEGINNFTGEKVIPGVTASAGASVTLDKVYSIKVADDALLYINSDANITKESIIDAITVYDKRGRVVDNPGFNYSFTDVTKPGSGTITATYEDYYAGSIQAEFTLYCNIYDNSALTVTLSGGGTMTDDGKWIYTGSAIEPVPTVKYNGTTLVKDTDYTVSYSGNTRTGNAVVTITGAGSYAGYQDVDFVIVPSITSAMVKVGGNSTWAKSDNGFESGYVATYTGSEIKPSLDVRYNGTPLVSGTDYEPLRFENNTNAGTAIVVITTKGRKFGVQELRVKFAIEPASIGTKEISLSAQTFIYDNTEHEPKVEITGLVKDVDYTVNYTSNKDAGTAKVIVAGQGNYFGTMTKDFTIQQRSIKDADVVFPSSSYTGSALEPKPTSVKLTIEDGSVLTLKEGEDYDADAITYRNNTNIGTSAQGTITGIGNYKGTASGRFSILPRSIIGEQIQYRVDTETFTYEDIQGSISGTGSNMTATQNTVFSQSYTGNGSKPSIVIKDGDKLLERNTDYELTFSNYINAGAQYGASVTVKGIGNYKNTGSVVFRYTITPRELNASSVDIDTTNMVARDNTSITVTGKSPALRNEALVLDRDYTVSWPSDYTTAGPGKVIRITGKGNFKGDYDYTFAQGIDISDLTKWELAIWDKATTRSNETGSVHKVGETDKDTGKYLYYVTYVGETANNIGEKCIGHKVASKTNSPLVQGTDYDIVCTAVSGDGYSVNSVVKVEAIGKGATYYGTLTQYYKVKPATLNAEDFLIAFDGGEYSNQFTKEYPYTGADIVPNFSLKYAPKDKVGAAHSTVAEVVLSTNDYSYEPEKVDGRVGNGKLGTITGVGNFEGTLSITYNVGAVTLTDAMVDVPSSVTYTGSQCEPEVVVTVNGKTLTKGTDYTVRYGANVNAGVAAGSVTVTGVQPNYQGVVTKTFDITKTELTNANTKIVLATDAAKYTGNEIKPSATGTNPVVTVIYNNRVTLEYGTDYTLDYENNKNPGRAKVKLKAVENSIYGVGEEISANFNIYLDLADINSYGIEGIPADKKIVYCGQDDVTGKSIWKYKSDPDTTFSESEIKIYVEDDSGRHYLNDIDPSNKPYAWQTANLSEATSNATIALNGAGKDKFCYGTRTIDGISVYIDASLLRVEGLAPTYPYTGLEVKPGQTVGSVKVYYGDRRLSEGTDYSLEYDLNGTSDFINVANGVSLNADRKVFVSGKGLFAGRAQKGTYNIKYDLSSATATGWKTTYTYAEIKQEAERAGTTVAAYKPKPVLKINDNVITDYASFKYTSSKGEGLSFNDAGAEVTVTASPDPASPYCYNSKTLTYKVTGINVSDDLIITPEATSFVYTGEQIRPSVKVEYPSGNVLDPADYTVSYSNNIDATEGTASKAKITVSVTGNYEGTKTAEFTIAKKDISAADSTVELVAPKITYTGNYIQKEELAGTILRDTANGKELKQGTDFDFSVESGHDAGTGTVNVDANAAKNYKGTKIYTYDIEKLNLSDAALTVSGSEAEYTGQPIPITVDLKMKLNGAKTETALDSSLYEVTFSGQTSVVDIGTYNIVIQPRDSSSANVTGTKTATFTVTGRWIGTSDYQLFEDATHNYTLTFDGVDYHDELIKNYTGEAIEPLVILKDGSKTLVKDQDYTVKYENNTGSSDQAKVIVEGIGNYAKKVEKTFCIGKKLPSNAVTLSEEVRNGLPYNGAEQKPRKVIVKDGTTELPLSKFDVTYSDDLVNVGTKTVTVTPKGTSGYYGTASATYDIVKRTLQAKDVVVTPDLPSDEYGYYSDYTGEAINPNVTVVVKLDGRNVELVKDTDYTVSYSEANTAASPNPGEAAEYKTAAIYVAIGGTNFNSLTTTERFRIKRGALSETDTVIHVNYRNTAQQCEDYTGAEIIPDLTVEQYLPDGHSITLTDADYEIISQENNIRPGEATVTIQGKGSFQGTASAKYNIKADLTDAFDKEEGNKCVVPQQLYTGATLSPIVDAVISGESLQKDTDYVIRNVAITEYENGNPSKGVVDIIGMNKYYGTCSREFTITTDLSEVELIYNGLDDVIYTGSPQKQTGFRIYDPSGNTISYSASGVTYHSDSDGDDCVKVGTVTVSIPITIGAINDVVTKTYEIKKAPIASATSTRPASSTYTGAQLCPTVELKYRGKDLVAGTDYTIVYDNNTKPTSRTSTGETPAPATVTITGINNFEGSYHMEFQIYPERMRELDAKASGANSIIVTWDKLAYVTGYRIDVMTTDSSIPVKSVEISNPNATSATVTGLSEGTTYSVRAYSYVTVEGKTHYGLLTAKTPIKTGIATPNISTTSNAKNKATISWTSGMAGTRYMIYRSDTANGEYKYIAKTREGATSFVDERVTSGNTYYYKIRSYRYPDEYGVFSDISAVTVK